MAKLKFDRTELAALVAALPKPTDQITLVKDEGIYMMSFATDPNERRPVVYAKGYNPTKDGDVYNKCRAAVGGDDMGEDIGTRKDYEEILLASDGDIVINITAKSISTSYTPKRTPEQIIARIKVLTDWLAKVRATGAPHSSLWSAKFTATVKKAEKELGELEKLIPAGVH